MRRRPRLTVVVIYFSFIATRVGQLRCCSARTDHGPIFVFHVFFIFARCPSPLSACYLAGRRGHCRLGAASRSPPGLSRSIARESPYLADQIYIYIYIYFGDGFFRILAFHSIPSRIHIPQKHEKQHASEQRGHSRSSDREPMPK